MTECRYHSSGDVLEPLNEVCRHRGVADLSEADLSAFETLLLAEYRKEVIGGGQLFFQYKRLNRSVEQRFSFPQKDTTGQVRFL